MSVADIEEAVSKVSTSASPSVVGIGSRWGAGSGVVIGEGKILTNAHNLRSEKVTVTFNDGRTAEAVVAGADFDEDIAVVKADTSGASPIDWTTNGATGAGKAVFALSNPGGKGLRISFGLVSGVDRSFRGPRGRRIGGGVEHTAALLPGSSGGPLVNAQGKLIGINTHRLGEGFYLAIPATEALKTKVDALSRGEAPSRPRLGIGVAPPEVAKGLRRAVGLPEADGLLVRQVEEGSPAEKAGIQEGDLITALGGKAISDVDALHEALASASGEIELKVLRGTQERTVKASI
ncbi:MAG: S1C family serine protease [Actinomycetota bacterium]